MPSKPILQNKDRKFLKALQDKHWQNFQEYSAASALFRNDKDFQLHLYDKLWENIIHKENRVWTFLTAYAAIIGIAMGTGLSKYFRFETGIVILLLTYWAAEIIISADWWSVRNRLMVRGIERRVYEATKGIVPTSFYHSPKYSSEPLHNISLLVFCAIGLIIFMLSVGIHNSDLKIKSFWDLFLMTILYCLSSFSLARCAHKREKNIADFFLTFRELNQQEDERGRSDLKKIDKVTLDKYETDERKEKSWRCLVLLVYLITTLMAGIKYYEFINTLSFIIIFLLFQAIVVVIYSFQWYQYRKSSKDYGFGIFEVNSEEKGIKKLNFILLLFFLISIILPFLMQPIKKSHSLISHISIGSQVTDLRSQLSKFDAELKVIENLVNIQNEKRFIKLEEAFKILSTVEKMENRLEKIVSENLSEIKKNTLNNDNSIKAIQQTITDLKKRLETFETSLLKSENSN